MSCFSQTSSSDLDLSSGNLTVQSDPAHYTAVKLGNRLQLFLGEWFVDTRLGVPYFQQIYVKNPDLAVIGQLFRQVILGCPGVASVLQANLDFVSNLRTLTATFVVQTDTGAVLTGGLGAPFIVTQGAS